MTLLLHQPSRQRNPSIHRQYRIELIFRGLTRAELARFSKLHFTKLVVSDRNLFCSIFDYKMFSIHLARAVVCKPICLSSTIAVVLSRSLHPSTLSTRQWAERTSSPDAWSIDSFLASLCLSNPMAWKDSRADRHRQDLKTQAHLSLHLPAPPLSCKDATANTGANGLSLIVLPPRNVPENFPSMLKSLQGKMSLVC
eukprot:765976-Hanusia_phi.AAC.3